MISDDTVLVAEHLAKEYVLASTPSYGRASEWLEQLVLSPFRAARPASPPKRFWALNDVSFEIKQGQIAGFVGRNGAGKSTLLKILSRITTPTRGRFGMRGRVGSLLEVGTGFHPELTGRENIFLNGAILGMKRHEIARHLDEIVAYAEVDDFIDTPVKHYSSGMYVRLAFSVAAHFHPDILILDEVLAVGDAAFQKKCLDTMRQFGKSGRTILLVSHNMSTVRSLCHQAIWLEKGEVAFTGTATEVADRYIASMSGTTGYHWRGASKSEVGDLELLEVEALQSDESPRSELDGKPLLFIERPTQLRIRYRVSKPLQCMTVFRFNLDDGTVFFSGCSAMGYPWERDQYADQARDPGIYETVVEIPAHVLIPTCYFVTVDLLYSCYSAGVHQPNCLKLEYQETADRRNHYVGPWLGLTRPLLKWQSRSMVEDSESQV